MKFTSLSPITISPGVGVLEAGDDAQDRALAAPGRAEQDEELAVGDLQRDVADGLDLAEALHQVLDQDLCHRLPSRPSGTVVTA